MHIWIDISNSPHAIFFRPLVAEFARRGHTIETTARDYAQTIELARGYGFTPAVIGAHAGAGVAAKGVNLFKRARRLARWARGRHFDLAVSHNSHDQIAAARLLGIPAVTLMDYEHHPANHFSFRLASRVIVPRVFPTAALERFGARRVERYDGIKEDVYLADFQPDPDFQRTLGALGITPAHVLVIVRAPAREALYHRFENDLFDGLLGRLGSGENIRAVMLPRTASQREELRTHYNAANFVYPPHALDGANLIAASDLVISAGGTMNREAAALGVPTWTIFAGEWGAVDDELVREGRMKRIQTIASFAALRFEKKQTRARNLSDDGAASAMLAADDRGSRSAKNVREQVTRLILGE